MNREDIFQYVKEMYGTEPDYPWMKAPENAILRHKEDRKWYAAILSPTRQQLGLEGEGSIDVINLKCDPELIGSIRMQKGILPGYHMNKEHWISILLDGTVSAEEICKLIDLSFLITSQKR